MRASKWLPLAERGEDATKGTRLCGGKQSQAKHNNTDGNRRQGGLNILHLLRKFPPIPMTAILKRKMSPMLDTTTSESFGSLVFCRQTDWAVL